MRSKQASQERAQADLARMKPLVAKTEISQQQFDAYTAAARVAQSELEEANDKLASAQQEAAIRKTALDGAQTRVDQAKAQLGTSVANRKQVDIRTADAGTASAAVAAARANLEAAELQLGYTTVAAPVDGVVTRKSVEVGQIVQPGQGLMTIIPLQDSWVTANFKETQLADVHPGQRVEIHVDMYGKKSGRPRGFDRRGHRRAHEPAAAGERHREFRESGAAHPGEDPGGPGARGGPAAGDERGRDDIYEVILLSISR